MDLIVLILIVVALILAIIDLWRTRGQSLVCWAVVLLAIALILQSGVLSTIRT